MSTPQTYELGWLSYLSNILPPLAKRWGPKNCLVASLAPPLNMYVGRSRKYFPFTLFLPFTFVSLTFPFLLFISSVCPFPLFRHTSFPPPKCICDLKTALGLEVKCLIYPLHSLLSEIQKCSLIHLLHCDANKVTTRQHLSYDDCLEDKREDYRNCSVLYCVT